MFAKKNLYWPLVILFIVSAPVFAQNNSSNPSELLIEKFKTHTELRSFWATLSAYYEIPIGFQEELNSKEEVDLSFEGGRLSKFLDKFVSENPTYTWALENEVIKIRPAEKYSDAVLSRILKTEISQFEIDGNADCWKTTERLLELTEAKKVIDAYGLKPYGSELGGFYIQQLGGGVKLNLSQVSFERILDSIVSQSPLAKLWTLRRFPAKKILHLEIIARQTESWRVVEPSVKFQNLVNFLADEP